MVAVSMFNVQAWIVGCLGMVAAVAGACKWIARKRRRTQAQGWPMVEMKIERSDIARYEGPEGGVIWRLRIVFGYRPPGLYWYSGVYTEDLASENDAERQMLSLRERRLSARYNPAKPNEYFVAPYRDRFESKRGEPNDSLNC